MHPVFQPAFQAVQSFQAQPQRVAGNLQNTANPVLFGDDTFATQTVQPNSQGAYIPLWLTRLKDSLSRGLPDAYAKALSGAMDQTQLDQEGFIRLKHQFVHALLVDPEIGVLRHATIPEAQQAIETVANLHQRVLEGEGIPEKEWSQAFWKCCDITKTLRETGGSDFDFYYNFNYHASQAALTASTVTPHETTWKAFGAMDPYQPAMVACSAMKTYAALDDNNGEANQIKQAEKLITLLQQPGVPH